MNQQERSEHAIDILSVSALWYAWGHIDARRDLRDAGYGTEHGQEFSRLFGQIALDYQEERRTSRPNVIDAWQAFMRSKSELGINAELTIAHIV